MRYSFSRINRFLQCPYAFYLAYIQKIQTQVGFAVEHGRYIHEQLEAFGKGEPYKPDAEPYVSKLRDFLDKTNDKIIQTEQRVNFSIDGYEFIAIIDALTQNDMILDYKTTTSPSSFADKVGFQLPLYHMALGKGDPKYLLFKVRGKEREFESLRVQSVSLTPELVERKGDYIVQIIKMIELCTETGHFPPSYNGCRTCFHKEYCPYYTGG